MPNTEFHDLQQKLAAGQCSAEEIDRLYEPVRVLPEEEALPVLQLLWDRDDFTQRLPSSFYQRLLQRIGQGKSRGATRRKSRRLPLIIAAAAATVLLLFFAGRAFYGSNNDYTTTTTTAYAEQRSVTLPDGSRVRLNANSTIRYAENWTETEDREVWLDGEAFFEVAKKPVTHQKFRVTTPDLSIAVLGTVFNVNTQEDGTSVFLEEGSIALQLKDLDSGEQLMAPGDLIKYSAARKEVIAEERNSQADVHTSWKDGVLTFEDTPMADVLRRLENIYGITISIEDSTVLDRSITGGVPMEDLEIVIPLLEQVTGYRLEGGDSKAYTIHR